MIALDRAIPVVFGGVILFNGGTHLVCEWIGVPASTPSFIAGTIGGIIGGIVHFKSGRENG